MIKNTVFAIAMALTVVACVPLKQYQEMKAENETFRQNSMEVEEENDALKVKNRELSADFDRLGKRASQLAADTLRLSRQLQRLQYKYNDLNDSYSEAIKGFKSQSGGDVDNRKLLAFLQELQNDLQKREDALMAAEQALNDKKKSLEMARTELGQAQQQVEAQNKRVAMLEKLLSEQEQAMQSLKHKISNALTGFSGDELQVHMKDGKVYVSLEEKLLFQSGKYEVNAQGVSALNKIAGVLKNSEDIQIVVEGHTDHVPFKGQGTLKDNWDLSVKRATTVVRILLADGGIEPQRVTAAGRSKYVPLMPGDEPQALRKNRRTEIILTPKWDEVLNLIDVE